MEELARRLRGLTPLVSEICKASGCPGVSVGIMHQNQVVFKQAYGYRDVENKIPPDEHTIYYLASLSKSFTAALIGILVERGQMEWDTPIKSILPTATQRDKTVQEKATIVDWMSHRTGLAPKNLIWSQEFGHQSLKRKDALPIISYLEKVVDFRTRWIYSNWGYAIADEVITKLSKESWGTMLKNEIFDPLGMSRTITEHSTDLDNIANAYMSFSDGTPYHVPRPFLEDGKIMEGACAVQSNVHDLLRYYSCVLESAKDQGSHGRTSTPGSPLKQVPMLVKAHIPLDPDVSQKVKSYGLGWILTELPNDLGVIGMNPRVVKEMPIVGEGLEKTHQCIYHQGSSNGFLSSVHMLPESHSVIVVLTNSLANNDTADWLGELFLQTLLDVPKNSQHDYLRIAKETAKRSNELWPEMRREIEAMKIPNTKRSDLSVYVGKYYNFVSTYYIEVTLEKGELWMDFQGEHEVRYDLEHNHRDTFSWLLTRDEDVEVGRFPVTRANFYLLEFKGPEGSDVIDRVVWVNDPYVPEGETFKKREEGNVAKLPAVDGPG